MTAESLAIEFTRALLRGDIATALDLTTDSCRAAVGAERIREDVEALIPSDWGGWEPLTVETVLNEWPTGTAEDVALVMVTIPGDVYSEAISVIVTMDRGRLAIRDVELGRP